METEYIPSEPEESKHKYLIDKLSIIQGELCVKKGRNNVFANFKYMKCEDILAEVRPYLKKYKIVLEQRYVIHRDANKPLTRITKDDAKKTSVTEEIYRDIMECIVRITDGVDIIESNGFAGIEQQKKGMDSSQVIGCASTYARKIALCGAFGVEDSQDPDELDNSTNRKVKNVTPPKPRTDYQKQASNIFPPKPKQIYNNPHNSVAPESPPALRAFVFTGDMQKRMDFLDKKLQTAETLEDLREAYTSIHKEFFENSFQHQKIKQYYVDMTTIKDDKRKEIEAKIAAFKKAKDGE